MATAEKTHKASVSIRESNWRALSTAPNKSKIVNKALELYFNYEQGKEEWENKFYGEWLDEALQEVENGGGTPVAMKDGKIDREAFMKEIWN